jgi:hypothetical protein
MSKTLFKFLVAVIAISSSSIAFAQANWVVVSDTDHMIYHIDTQSIKKSGQFAKVWSLIEYKTPKQNGYFLAKSVLSLEEYDCKEDRIRTLSQTQYTGSMGQGDKYSIDLSNEKWGYIAPNTISDSIEKFVCKKK